MQTVNEIADPIRVESQLRLDCAWPPRAQALRTADLEGRGDMFVTIDGNRVYVTLSRRNLRQLHALLEGQDAGRNCLARRDGNGVSLVVQVEDDADHYDGRNAGPGKVAHQPREVHS
jgi:hypothetical protein